MTDVGEADCRRLLAVSQWAPSQSAVGELLEQRQEWLQRAQQSGVRTALLHACGWLVQWHEGSVLAVATEWQRLRAGQLGRHARLLHSSRGRAVLRDPVQITSLHAPDRPTDVARRLHALEREQAQGGTAEPAQIWQSLVAPHRLRPVGLPGRVASRVLLAVAGEKNDAVDVVRLIAQQQRLQVSYQRYANWDLERRDVGGAYIDVPREGARIARVQALPRQALDGGALLLGVAHIDHLLVLLRADVSRGRALLAEVARLLATLAHVPQVHLVCRCPDALRHAAEVFDGLPDVRCSIFVAPASAHSAADLASTLLDGSEAAPA